MQIDKISSNTFGMAKVSPEIEMLIEQGRNQVKGTQREDTFERNVEMIRNIMPDAKVRTTMERKQSLLGKIFGISPKFRENVFVNGKHRTYIEGIPMEGNHCARRIECLAHVLRNIENYDREQKELEFQMMDDALDY